MTCMFGAGAVCVSVSPDSRPHSNRSHNSRFTFPHAKDEKGNFHWWVGGSDSFQFPHLCALFALTSAYVLALRHEHKQYATIIFVDTHDKAIKHGDMWKWKKMDTKRHEFVIPVFPFRFFQNEQLIDLLTFARLNTFSDVRFCSTARYRRKHFDGLYVWPIRFNDFINRIACGEVTVERGAYIMTVIAVVVINLGQLASAQHFASKIKSFEKCQMPKLTQCSCRNANNGGGPSRNQWANWGVCAVRALVYHFIAATNHYFVSTLHVKVKQH